MLRFRREVGSGTVKALTLCCAAQRIERALVTGSQTYGVLLSPGFSGSSRAWRMIT
jgi:hypothetical protein